ncbi:MAG: hypothetical protein MJ210_05735 [Alphaproteobacteria bacterium]|nr:hypothetical protein [Alphaproteobacteria bacterium]
MSSNVYFHATELGAKLKKVPKDLERRNAEKQICLDCQQPECTKKNHCTKYEEELRKITGPSVKRRRRKQREVL